MSLVLFNGIRALMRVDKICRDAGLSVKVVPVPHTYSTECGMSLIVEENDIPQFKEIIAQLGIEVTIIGI